jgi:hypothetical protein
VANEKLYSRADGLNFGDFLYHQNAILSAAVSATASSERKENIPRPVKTLALILEG